MGLSAALVPIRFEAACARVAPGFAEASPSAKRELLSIFGDYSIGQAETRILLRHENRDIRYPLFYEELARKASSLEGISDDLKQGLERYFRAVAYGDEIPADIMDILLRDRTESKKKLSELIQFTERFRRYRITQEEGSIDIGHGTSNLYHFGPAKLFSELLSKEGGRKLSQPATIAVVEDADYDWPELLMSRGFTYFEATDRYKWMHHTCPGEIFTFDLPPRSSWYSLSPHECRELEALITEQNMLQGDNLGMFTASDHALTIALRWARWPDVWMIDIEQEGRMNGIALARTLHEIAVLDQRDPVLVICSNNTEKYQDELDEMLRERTIDFYFDKRSWERVDEIIGILDDLIIKRRKALDPARLLHDMAMDLRENTCFAPWTWRFGEALKRDSKDR